MGGQPKHVALLIPAGWEATEPFRRGVLAYVRDHGDWVVMALPEWRNASVRALAHWGGDGAMVEARTAAEVQFAAALPFPVVNLMRNRPPGRLPQAITDDEAVGRLGAEHFLERGFTQCVYYGMLSHDYAVQRLDGFRRRLLADGVSCVVFGAPSLLAPWPTWDRHREKLDAFLRGLSPPFAVMASDDMRARLVIEACGRVGFMVPGDVAVLGVDNLPLMCEFCKPPLSSVDRGVEHLGFETARLLDDLMRRHRPLQPVRLVAPKGVVSRGSTDTLAVRDPHVRAAVAYMRANLHRPFGVEQVAAQAAVSRRWLEHRFREALGVTIHQHLSRLRVDGAKHLLRQTPPLPLSEVASRCGFTGPKRLRIVFGRLTGHSPRAFRSMGNG
jgi:LacI family transcriptional regulator